MTMYDFFPAIFVTFENLSIMLILSNYIETAVLSNHVDIVNHKLMISLTLRLVKMFIIIGLLMLIIMSPKLLLEARL